MLVGAVFGVVALYVPEHRPSARPWPASTSRSSSDINWLDISKVGAVIVFVFVVMAMSNGVNLTDGLDGLATGASVMVLGAYALIAFWQYRHWCADPTYARRRLLLRGPRPAGDRA